VHPCRASLRFRRLWPLTRLMHARRELGGTAVYFCPDTLFPVQRTRLSPFLHPANALSLSLSLPLSVSFFPISLSRPSWRFPPISSPSPSALRVLRPCQGAVSLLPFRPLLSPLGVMSCLLSLASSPTPRHNLPQTLKKIRRLPFLSRGNSTVRGNG